MTEKGGWHIATVLVFLAAAVIMATDSAPAAIKVIVVSLSVLMLIQWEHAMTRSR